MPPVEFLRGVIDAGARKSTDTRLSRRMTQPFGYLKFPASFIGIIIGCLIFVDGNAFADYFSPGDHTITLTHEKRERGAVVHVPPHTMDKRDIPVVLNFHGGGGHRAHQEENSLVGRAPPAGELCSPY